MKKLLAAMFAALLMVGCGEEAQWEANPEPYGGLKILAEIKEARARALAVGLVATHRPPK